MLIRAQVNLPMKTALPEDTVINSWHFLTADASTLTLDAIGANLSAFYGAISALLASNIAGRVVKFYDLGEPAPRAPKRTDTVAYVPTGTSAVPEEVAICLSFQGAQVSGQNQARRRGRVFLGPVGSGTITETDERITVSSAARTTIKNAAAALLTSSQGSTVFDWVVYSPTTAAGGGPADSWAVPVANGWVDDSFDTIRSRGTKPRTRTVFP